jgi:steroid delta-isomerase
MADANQIRQTYQRYTELVNKGDVDGILELYADDASIEDPVGSEPRVGRDAIRAFYEASAGTITMKVSGSVRVAGHEAATPLKVLMGPEGEQSVLEIISTMAFDEAGKVTAMRAFWSLDAIRPATADD